MLNKMEWRGLWPLEGTFPGWAIHLQKFKTWSQSNKSTPGFASGLLVYRSGSHSLLVQWKILLPVFPGGISCLVGMCTVWRRLVSVAWAIPGGFGLCPRAKSPAWASWSGLDGYSELSPDGGVLPLRISCLRECTLLRAFLFLLRLCDAQWVQGCGGEWRGVKGAPGHPAIHHELTLSLRSS